MRGKPIPNRVYSCFIMEHPRVCGENVPVVVGVGSDPGTSPRMRGKLPSFGQVPLPARNIPAYAGKTDRGRYSRIAGEEHPRVCGENLGGLGDLVRGGGTSPRMRGKQLFQGDPSTGGRNIPAYAGKTRAACCGGKGAAEHPRVCGENLTNAAEHIIDSGTSPRMRGKRNSARQDMPLSEEHPRVCGENPMGIVTNLRKAGTSPRMRGKPDQQPKAIGYARNIPAYAGKTPIGLTFTVPVKEHPRVCGENINKQPLSQLTVGTSPRMRGKLWHTSNFVGRFRNIPAYAGKTLDLR